jgi:hypothetical protein
MGLRFDGENHPNPTNKNIGDGLLFVPKRIELKKIELDRSLDVKGRVSSRVEWEK